MAGPKHSRSLKDWKFILLQMKIHTLSKSLDSFYSLEVQGGCVVGLFHMFLISKCLNSNLIFYRIVERFYAEQISLVMLLLCADTFSLMFDFVITTKLHLNWHGYVHFPVHANTSTLFQFFFQERINTPFFNFILKILAVLLLHIHQLWHQDSWFYFTVIIFKWMLYLIITIFKIVLYA